MLKVKTQTQEIIVNVTRQHIIQCCVKYNQVRGTDLLLSLLKGSRMPVQLGLMGGPCLEDRLRKCVLKLHLNSSALPLLRFYGVFKKVNV